MKNSRATLEDVEREKHHRCVESILNDKFINTVVNEQAKIIALAPIGKITMGKGGCIIKYKLNIQTICAYKQMGRIADYQREKILNHYNIKINLPCSD